MIDRSEINRCLAKAIAYKQCGKQAEAECWAAMLIAQLECLGILRADFQDTTLINEALSLPRR